MSLPVWMIILGIVLVAVGCIFGARNLISMFRGIFNNDMPQAAEGFARHFWAIAAVIIGFAMVAIGVVLVLVGAK